CWRDIALQRSEVVVKDVGRGVDRCAMAAGAHISGAQIALRVILLGSCGCSRFGLALPWTLRPMRRYNNPLAPQRIPAPVRGFSKHLEHQRASFDVLSCAAFRASAPSTASQTYVSRSSENLSRYAERSPAMKSVTSSVL